MFGSTVLEVAIGLAFCYATLALVVTTLQEALAGAFHLRANMLLDAVRRMLGDPRCEGLARALYAHPLANPRTGGAPASDRPSRPSYIEPGNFAIALIDSIRQGHASLEAAIGAVPDPQLQRTLQTLYSQAGADPARFQAAVAAWFEAAMERLSGVYKRRQLLVSFLLSLLLAILFNIDSIHLFRTLWQQPALAAQIGAMDATLSAAMLDQLWALPIGWQTFPPTLDAAFALQAAGWLVTASTTLFGAPFWFDVLQRAVNLRSTGAKPAPLDTRFDGGVVPVAGMLVPAAAPGSAPPVAAAGAPAATSGATAAAAAAPPSPA
ncbi:hypothetical protein [Massilia sp.]|uniref:hypothetical protein n=1 Tax=Massilia sp. TaxID=1882437 RepID=UPI0028A18B86|nr:hypothetical protein [Massilia sp.]